MHIKPLPPDLLDLIGRNGGSLRRQEALAAGLTDGEIRGRRRRGDLVDVHRGRYRLPGAGRSWRTDALGVSNALSPGAALSHSSAAVVLGIDGARPTARIEVTVPYGLGVPDLHGVKVHRSRVLGPPDVMEREGLLLTTASRTVIDLATRQDEVETIDLVDRVIGAGVTDRARLHARSVQLASGRRGVGVITAVTAPGAEDTFRSRLERDGAALLRGAGITGVRWNVPIHDDGRVVAIVDALIEQAALPIEFDGLAFHEQPPQRQHDRQRQNLLRKLNLFPLRYTWSDIYREPERVIREIADALRAAGCAHLLRSPRR